MGICIKPLGDNSSLQSVNNATRVDCYGFVRPAHDGTNTVSTVSSSPTLRRPTRVDRGVEYAASRHGNLLRRLAD